MPEQEYVVYTARINVSRVYEIEIAVPKTDESEDIATRAANNADTMFLHKHGRLEDVSIEYSELTLTADLTLHEAEILVEPGVNPNDSAFHVEVWDGHKTLVFGKEAPPYDGIPWEDKI